MNFMIVGHTHDDIDALFGRWSMDLKKDNFPTIPAVVLRGVCFGTSRGV